MDLNDLVKTVAKFGAPILGGIIAGPAGAAAASALASKFDADPANPAEIVSKIESDPHAADKLIELQKIALDEEKARLADKQNARAREIAISALPIANRDNVPERIAMIFIGGYFALALTVIAAICFATVTNDELAPILQMLKDMGMAIMLILAYYYGSANKRGD